MVCGPREGRAAGWSGAVRVEREDVLSRLFRGSLCAVGVPSHSESSAHPHPPSDLPAPVAGEGCRTQCGSRRPVHRASSPASLTSSTCFFRHCPVHKAAPGLLMAITLSLSPASFARCTKFRSTISSCPPPSFLCLCGPCSCRPSTRSPLSSLASHWLGSSVVCHTHVCTHTLTQCICIHTHTHNSTWVRDLDVFDKER